MRISTGDMTVRFALPHAVQIALDRMEAAGYEAYPVGGCVRDFLRGITPFDFDLTTNARPEAVSRIFSDYTVVETGIKHGTVTVLVDSTPLEITTFRTDVGYSDGRHPDRVEFSSTLEEDLSRRDFTINALAYHRVRGVIDLFGGHDDLEKKRIRCVGDASTRFTEDALRILRGLRFASTLDFTIETATARAMFETKETLHFVSRERITDEIARMVCGVGAARVAREFLPILKEIIPGLRPDFEKLQTLPPAQNLRLAALLGDVSTLSHLRLSKKDASAVKSILTSDPPILLTRFSALSCKARYREYANDVCIYHGVSNLDEMCGDGVYLASQLAISGKDLLARGYEGKAVGEILSRMLLRVMRGEIKNTRESLMNSLED